MDLPHIAIGCHVAQRLVVGLRGGRKAGAAAHAPRQARPHNGDGVDTIGTAVALEVHVPQGLLHIARLVHPRGRGRTIVVWLVNALQRVVDVGTGAAHALHGVERSVQARASAGQCIAIGAVGARVC